MSQLATRLHILLYYSLDHPLVLQTVMSVFTGEPLTCWSIF